MTARRRRMAVPIAWPVETAPDEWVRLHAEPRDGWLVIPRDPAEPLDLTPVPLRLSRTERRWEHAAVLAVLLLVALAWRAGWL